MRRLPPVEGKRKGYRFTTGGSPRWQDRRRSRRPGSALALPRHSPAWGSWRSAASARPHRAGPSLAHTRTGKVRAIPGRAIDGAAPGVHFRCDPLRAPSVRTAETQATRGMFTGAPVTRTHPARAHGSRPSGMSRSVSPQAPDARTRARHPRRHKEGCTPLVPDGGNVAGVAWRGLARMRLPERAVWVGFLRDINVDGSGGGGALRVEVHMVRRGQTARPRYRKVPSTPPSARSPFPLRGRNPV